MILRLIILLIDLAIMFGKAALLLYFFYWAFDWMYPGIWKRLRERLVSLKVRVLSYGIRKH